MALKWNSQTEEYEVVSSNDSEYISQQELREVKKVDAKLGKLIDALAFPTARKTDSALQMIKDDFEELRKRAFENLEH